MSKYRIFDAHTHIYPQKIADKAVKAIGDFYDIPMDSDGMAESLLAEGKKIGVEKYLVCSAATKPSQVLHTNDFIYRQCQNHPEFVGFATLHPDMNPDEMEMEVARIVERGFKGIKLHPDFQKFNIDDENAMNMYRLAEKAKLFILFHTGDDRYTYSKPHRLMNVCERFPDLKCIAAHFGGYQCWDEAFTTYHSPNIYYDTSSSLFKIGKETVYKFLEKYGVDHFFFGTDFPMWTHEEELARFEALQLDEETKKAILGENFARVILGEKASAK